MCIDKIQYNCFKEKIVGHVTLTWNPRTWRWMQEDQGFKITLSCIGNLHPVWTLCDPASNRQQQQYINSENFIAQMKFSLILFKVCLFIICMSGASRITRLSPVTHSLLRLYQ